jgi:hypothetical protein
LPSSGFAFDLTAAGAETDWIGAARKTVVVEPESVQPVALPIPRAAMPPTSAQATASAARGPIRTPVAL